MDITISVLGICTVVFVAFLACWVPIFSVNEYRFGLRLCPFSRKVLFLSSTRRRIGCRVARVGLSAYAFEYEMSQDCWSTSFGLILTLSLVRTTWNNLCVPLRFLQKKGYIFLSIGWTTT